MKLTSAKFDSGMTPQDYIDQIKVNKQPFLDIHKSIELPDEARAFVDDLEQPLRITALTADWCGDAMTTTPAVLRLAEISDKLTVRVFNRDVDLELTDSFLPDNRAGTVPVFVITDASMVEIARFIETANELVPAIDAMDEDVQRRIASESTDDGRAAARGRRTAHRVAHANQWGQVVLREFVGVVAEGLSAPQEGRPTVGGTRWPPEN